MPRGTFPLLEFIRAKQARPMRRFEAITRIEQKLGEAELEKLRRKEQKVQEKKLEIRDMFRRDTGMQYFRPGEEAPLTEMEAVPAILAGERLERREMPTPPGLAREVTYGPTGRRVTFKEPTAAKILDPQVRSNLDMAKRFEAQADKYAKRGERELASGMMDMAFVYTRLAGERMTELWGTRVDQFAINQIEEEYGSEIVNEVKKFLQERGLGKVPGVRDLLEVPTRRRRELVPEQREGVVPGRPAPPGDLTSDISQANTVATTLRGMAEEGDITDSELQSRLDDMLQELLTAYPDREEEIRRMFKTR